MKYVLRAWGELKRGCWVLALGKICYWVKCVLRAWGQLQRGCEVLALVGEICFEGMGAVGKGV